MLSARGLYDFASSTHVQGQPGEQWTMFFKDPSGNNLEFKAMTNVNNLFAKYNVDEFDYGDDPEAKNDAVEVVDEQNGEF